MDVQEKPKTPCGFGLATRTQKLTYDYELFEQDHLREIRDQKSAPPPTPLGCCPHTTTYTSPGGLAPLLVAPPLSCRCWETRMDRCLHPGEAALPEGTVRFDTH